jgi:hypothetical protein
MKRNKHTVATYAHILAAWVNRGLVDAEIDATRWDGGRWCRAQRRYRPRQADGETTWAECAARVGPCDAQRGRTGRSVCPSVRTPYLNQALGVFTSRKVAEKLL